MNDNKFTIVKWLIFAALVAATVACIWPPSQKIRLGLDLAGGMSFTAQIDEEQLLEDLATEEMANGVDEAQARKTAAVRAEDILRDADSRAIEVIRNRIDGLGVNEPLIAPSKNHRIIVEIPGADEEQRTTAEAQISDRAKLEFRLVHVKNGQLTSDLIAKGDAPEGYKLIHAENGTYFERTPEFKRLVRDPDYKRRLRQFGNPDPNYIFMLEKETLKDGREVFSPCYVQKRVVLDGDLLDSADYSIDPASGQYQVNMKFNKEGARSFGKVTSDYCPNGTKNRNSPVGRQLAIILDDTLYSAPVLREPIMGGAAQITGNFSRDDALRLSNVLKSGSLPAPVKIIEKRMIDPSLGSDAIHSGIKASIIGGILVAGFMIVYYCFLGVVADIALFLNLVLLPVAAILIAGFFNSIKVTDAGVGGSVLQLPVLTMPGIAGIVLTIGMAVDANVLIFERIREELKTGKSAIAAIAAGYDRAFLAIFDSNITTLLTGIILFIFGSGPIRGFAITLSAGIIVSMYTALVLTRMILHLCVKETSKAPKIMEWFKIPRFDFLGYGRLAMTVSAVIIVVTLAIFGIRCKTNARSVMAIDFTGGTVMTYGFAADAKIPQVADMTGALKAGGIDDVIVRVQKSADGSTDVVEVKSGYETVNGGVPVGKAINEVMSQRFGDLGIVNKGQDTIGPQIGDDLKKAATRAVCWALVGMLVYISLRFEFGFALGAVVALLHDVLITLGLFSLFGRQIGTTAIACFLTIVGYSVNDTIVIFDRIREDLKKNPNLGFKDLCNRSITVTLSRTVITSLTTLLAVLSLLVFGGGAIFDFALCMTIGVIAGIYSTIFIATPVMAAWYKGRRPAMAKNRS